MLTAKDSMYMHIALELSRAALAEDQLPVGCVIVRHDGILAQARKLPDGHHILDHAEMLAIRQAFKPQEWDMAGVTLYTTLEPCLMCWGTILTSRIPRVVFALEDPYGGASCVEGACVKRHRDRRPEVYGGLGRGRALRQFRQYFDTTANPYWSSHRDNPLVKVCY